MQHLPPPDVLAAGEAAPALQIHLLGPPLVLSAGRPLSMTRRQVRALLYFLAAKRQLVPREELCYLFWSEAPEAVARRNLTALLTYLRRALPLPDLLAADGDLLRLDHDRTWVDTEAVEYLCVRREPGRADILQQAVDLYRGSFLAGFSLPGCPEFEAWVTRERQTWERVYLGLLASLIDNLAAAGDCAPAIALARRYLETDNLAEGIHRRLIELYAASGDRGAALAQFEECLTVLEQELGVSPLPETWATYQAVLQGISPDRAARAGPLWRIWPGLDLPFVGRDEALARLEELCACARSGRGRMLLISGEAGIGKSRLMQELALRVQAGTLVLVGCSHPETQSMPYHPLVEALRPALIAQHPAGHIGPAWLAEASRLMPELRDIYPALPDPLPDEPEQARARLFESLAKLILGLVAGSRPVLFCLDDLHWADDSTLAWLAFLGHKLYGSRLLIVGTFQSGHAQVVAGLRQALARHNVLAELGLEGLDEAAVLQLLNHLADRLPADALLARRLWQTTGGNPFFLVETLRSLCEAGPTPARWRYVNGLQAWPLPATIRSAVEARLACLSLQARQILEAGAVLGQVFSFDLLQRTVGRHDLETMDGLDELVARRLLRPDKGGYAFCHQVTQAAVYHSLSPGRRRLLHRRAAEALEVFQPNDAGALARHLECSAEYGRAAQYALRAGHVAKAVFGHAEARACFERVLQLLDKEAATLRDPARIAANRRLRIQALDERGWALRLLGDMDTYASDLQEVARLAGSLSDPALLAHLHWRQAYTHRWFCRYDEARRAAEAGLGASIAAGDRSLEAMCRREVGLAARETGNYALAQSCLEQALNLFVETEDTLYQIHTLGNLSTLAWYQGAYEQALTWARQGLACCEQSGSALDRRIPLGDLGAAASALGDAHLARRFLAESLTIARQIEDRTQEIFCLAHLGWLCVGLEQAAEAREHLQAGLALAEGIGSRTEQSRLLSGLAEAHRLAGEPKQARTCAVQALDCARTCGRPFDERLARLILDRLAGG
jgi:DNA-binding SARP family transcriptional activator